MKNLANSDAQGAKAALASYARQQGDDRLLNMAMKIQVRATQRIGQLLKEFDGRPDNAKKQKDDTVLLLSKEQAAEEAGLSERQRKTSTPIANVPEDEFEAADDAGFVLF